MKNLLNIFVFVLLTDSEMSILLGDEVKQLKMEQGKSYSSHRRVNIRESQRHPQAIELKDYSQENVTGTKRPHLAKTARKEGSQDEITTNKTTNINDNVQEHPRFREQSSSEMNNDKNKAQAETNWGTALPGKGPVQNQDVFNGHHTVGSNRSGKVSGTLILCTLR